MYGLLTKITENVDGCVDGCETFLLPPPLPDPLPFSNMTKENLDKIDTIYTYARKVYHGIDKLDYSQKLIPMLVDLTKICKILGYSADKGRHE